MALRTSPLSQVCKAIRAHLDTHLNGTDLSKVTVLLGTPADAASLASANDGKHYLNLFFFRFEPSGLFPDTLPGDTDWLRTFCLATPYTAPEGTTSAGENDLRLLGEVVRVFHEQPTLTFSEEGEDYHLQVMLQPLALDQLNQLWSTQGDSIYRPSAQFEISLVPVVPRERTLEAPRAAGLGLAVQPGLAVLEGALPGRGPEVPVMTPAVGGEGWVPAIAWVQGGACAFSLGFALGSPELTGFVPQVWLAGKAGERVRLHWEGWDAAQGWQPLGVPVDLVIADPAIDPGKAAEAVTQALALPFDDHPGQLLLYAERSYARAADGAALTVRSNPLLINLYLG